MSLFIRPVAQGPTFVQQTALLVMGNLIRLTQRRRGTEKKRAPAILHLCNNRRLLLTKLNRVGRLGEAAGIRRVWVVQQNLL